MIKQVVAQACRVGSTTIWRRLTCRGRLTVYPTRSAISAADRLPSAPDHVPELARQGGVVDVVAELGVGQAGFDVGDTDVAGAELGAQAGGQLGQCRLGGAVDGVVGEGHVRAPIEEMFTRSAVPP
jgi:hypothetical protein